MTGQDLIDMAETQLGQPYVFGVIVPKNDANYKGPFDCAELVSWAVYQVTGKLYGCDSDVNPHPETADAGTPYWTRDVQNQKVKGISIAEARATPGAILLREAGDGLDGHIVFSKGDGTTMEAKGTKWGEVNDVVDGRKWTVGILLNEIAYTPNEVGDTVPIPTILEIGKQNDSAQVVAVQAALINKGYNLSNPDGIYGPLTAQAVRQFQVAEGLTPDGEVGPQTKSALGL